MPTANRFEIVAPLPSRRSHLHVAVDRGTRPACAVVLALYPRTLSDDPGRLARLSGEMERAALLFHPNVLPPVGIEAVGDDLAAVTVWRDAVTLRELLDAGGALPPEIAARIAADVCAGLSHAHGRPQPVVHGLLRPEAVLLDESGAALVSGFGMPGGSGVADDLLGVAELLHECLAGEAPDDPSRPLGESEAPAALAAVVNQARTAVPAGRPPTAEALGAAIAAALPLATPATVAAYVNAVLPVQGELRAERRRKIEAALAAASALPPDDFSEEITDEDILLAGSAFPGDGETPADLPAEADSHAAEAPPDESATLEPSEPWPPDPREASAGYGALPVAAPAASAPTPVPIASAPNPAPIASAPTPVPIASAANPAAASRAAGTSPARAAPISSGAPTSGAAAWRATDALTAAAAASVPATAGVDRRKEAGGGRRVSLRTAIAMSLGGVAAGFVLATFTPWHGAAAALLRGAANRISPSPEATSPGSEPPPEAAAPGSDPAADPSWPGDPGEPGAAAPPAPARRAASKAAAKKPRPRQVVTEASDPGAETGLLEITAPEGTEIWLDGRRIGTGNTRRSIPAGDHRVEARRGGARIGESFHLSPGETWTYAITPR